MKKTTKTRYRVRDWKQYNQALVNRGNLTLWINQEALEQWNRPEASTKRGAPQRYSQLCIMAILSIGVIMRLPLRQMEGMTQGILKLIGSGLRTPDYTTLCRRRQSISVDLGVRPSKEPRDVVVDGSGLKIYGEGEWKVRKHGPAKHRRWLKIHMAIDAKTHEVLMTLITINDTSESQMTGGLLEGIAGQIARVTGDGGYDTITVHEEIAKRGAKAIIPPRKGARILQHGNCKGPPHARDEALRHIRKHGKKHWKQSSGYHKRSLVETAFSRIKRNFGSRLRTRNPQGQTNDVLIRCRVLNQMTHLGMPQSYPVV